MNPRPEESGNWQMAQSSDSGAPGGMAAAGREDWGEDEGTRGIGGTRGASPELEERGGPRGAEDAFPRALAESPQIAGLTGGGAVETEGEGARC